MGDLDSSGARVVGGKTAASGVIELVDQNVAPGEIVKTPTADLNVVIPVSLEISCLPHNSWSVLANREISFKIGIITHAKKALKMGLETTFAREKKKSK